MFADAGTWTAIFAVIGALYLLSPTHPGQ